MNKKILIINNGLAGGGIEKASSSFANYLAEQNTDVFILALYKSEHFFKLDARITFIEPSFTRNSFRKYLYIFKLLWYIKLNTKRINPDTVLSYGEWINPFVLLALQFTKYPVFVSDRMNPLAKLPFLSENLRKVLYKKAAGIIAQTNFAKKVLFEKTKSKNIKVIPNPLTPIEGVVIEKKNKIISVGRLTSEKGHQYLLKAFSLIKNVDWELSIVGDGNERDSLEKLSQKLQIDDRIIFHGHMKDFSKLMYESKIFVLPSLKEGFPNALIEAMSVPLPCITTNFFEGENEIINQGVNGFVISPGSVEELAEALNLLINDSDLREKIAINAFKVRENYNFDKIAKQYMNFINN